jgi:hypothetical protein
MAQSQHGSPTTSAYGLARAAASRAWLVGNAGIAVKEVICEGWEHPRSARTESRTIYPSFSIVYCNGVIDVVEHRRMEPVFYMSDDEGLQREAVESAKRHGMIVE